MAAVSFDEKDIFVQNYGVLNTVLENWKNLPYKSIRTMLHTIAECLKSSLSFINTLCDNHPCKLAKSAQLSANNSWSRNPCESPLLDLPKLT